MKIPVECEPVIGAPALTFTRWLPLGKANGISVTRDGIQLVLWFELAATHGVDADALPHHVNVPVTYVRVDAMINDVEPAVATYMQKKDFSRQPTPEETQVQQSYDELAGRILRLSVESVNQLIAYARAIKGQYWLLDLPLDFDLAEICIHFKALGRVDGGPPFRFQPNTHYQLRISIPNEERYLSSEDWPAAVRFVQEQQRTPFVLDLLARAERLASQGHSRTALTEAVTALEIALSTFGNSKAAGEKLARIYGPRLGVEKLGEQIAAFGKRGSLRFLLPLILPENVLPTEVLTTCQEAVDERNNVVHNGKRDVPAVNKYVKHIRRCCEILRSEG